MKDDTNINSNIGEVARVGEYSSQGAPTQQVPPAGYMPPQAPAGNYAPPPPPNQWSTPPAQPVYNAPAIVRDRRRQNAPIVGPVILIGAGVVFLLNNLGILPWGIWNQLWRLWPLILIAIGLDLLIGRRSTWLSLLIVLLVVGAGVAFVLSNGGFQANGDIVSANINVPLSGAKSADATVNAGIGNLTLNANTDSESLATGTLEYYQDRGAPIQEVGGNADRATLTLRQRDTNFNLGSIFGSFRSPEWNIHLNPNIPLTLNADLGTGNSTLDLSGLKITNVDVNSGTGNTTVMFPANAGHITGSIDGGVGNLNIKIPDGLETRIDISTGLGNTNIDNRFTKQGDKIYVTSGYNNATNKLDLRLNVGVGNLEISR
ncbi:MAG: DUF5668 domain-containing protein [Chloroflexota bacterium]